MFNKLDYCEVVVIGPNSQLGWSKKKEPYVNRSVALGEVSASSLRGRSGSMWGWTYRSPHVTIVTGPHLVSVIAREYLPLVRLFLADMLGQVVKEVMIV